MQEKRRKVILSSRQELMAEDFVERAEREGIELDKGAVLTNEYLTRHYDELCKKGRPICKVIDAATGKALSDSNFAFNSSSVLSEMGYNVQAAANMTAAQRQEILRKAVEEKGVSVNEILNLLELQIRLHSDRESYQSAVDKWKEDSDFVKSYGIGSGRLKRMDE